MELLCRVTHTSICRLYACSTDGPQRCLVLELCTGGSLEDRIECAGEATSGDGGGGGGGGGGGNGGGGGDGGCKFPPLQWDHRLRIAVAMARALKHLHTLTPPMLHRDVKSANVLLDEAGNAKVPRIRQQNCAAPSPTPASNLRANFLPISLTLNSHCSH
jgi:interleukin-1 receptor-associated kinase 1